jgi:trehalose/maltose hydrolase-like predicted phosphorylase
MAKRETRNWELIYTDWNPQEQPLREALCALGNGYIVTRGAFEEVSIGGIHYPGTYLAGGYNRLETEIDEHVLESESLVNWSNWLPLSFRPEDGDWFDLNNVKLLDFCYRLNVYSGVLERSVRFRDANEREFSLTSRRLVHMENPHLAAIEWRLKAHNWSGQIEIC